MKKFIIKSKVKDKIRSKIPKRARLLAVLLAAGVIFTSLSGFGLSAEAAEEPSSLLQQEDLEWIAKAREALQPIVQERDIMALVYLCDTYEVRESAAADSAVIATAYSGQTVNILDVELAEDEGGLAAWAWVSFYEGDSERQGYIERSRLACSDERFLSWEAEYGMNPGDSMTYSAEGVQRDSYADIALFPESYQAALIQLKQKHPQWTFVPLNTGLDWQTVINNEITGGRSLVHKSLADCTKEGSYDGGSWYYASEDILKYYMDPRNALTEDAIFQFELLTYNATYHTEAAVEKFLASTFMNSSQYAPGTAMTFAKIFWAVGAEEGRQVSPFHLAARVYQEQGQGTSPLVSGVYTGQDNSLYGYYNYFNVGATGKSNEECIINGLTYARDHGWSNAYASILGGADVISANYIRKGQDTLYLQKYNVNPHSSHALYTHQYMQNISAPTSEAKSVKRLYESTGSLDNTFVFKIPVYSNMPAWACGMPTASTNVVLQIPAGYDATVWLDGVQYASVSRNGRNIVTAPDGNVKSAVVYRYDGAGVPVGMYVWTLDYVNNAYRVTEQPELTDLLSYHGFSIRLTGKSGIRFMSGISPDLKYRLAGEGVNGYRLKEYGTLAMNNANRGAYPMIKGGEKVAGGLAYGIDANGQLADHIFETVDGRQRFTSVLVGLPADQYKVEFAFRGYVVLEKDGRETILYGPVRARSIYSLAEQFLNMGTYPEGSKADIYLRQLIADANAVGG